MRSLATPALAILAITLTPSCNHYRVTKLANYNVAVSMGHTVTTDPPVIAEDAASIGKLPTFVPYAIVHGDFYPNNQSDASMASSLRGQAMEHMPDFLIFRNLGHAYAGSVSNYIGFGVSYSTPVNRPQALVFCCRYTRARFGIRTENNGMVIEMDDRHRESGLLEGDILVSVDGANVKEDGTISPFAARWLGYSPGDEAKLSWIRPGIGRMSGSIRALPSSPPPILSSIAEKPYGYLPSKTANNLDTIQR